MIANCVVMGLLIASFGLWATLVRQERWQVWTVILFSIWLFIAPETLHDTVPLITWNNVIVGLTVKLTVVNKTGKEVVLAILGPGDFVGEACLVGQSICISTAIAITPTAVRVIEKPR